MTGSVVRWLTGWWPRSSAERFADRLFAEVDSARDVVLEASGPLVGDDAFDPYDPGPLGDPVLPEPFWGCRVHGRVGPCAVCQVDEECAPAASVVVGVGPVAGERSPRPRPATGHPNESGAVLKMTDGELDLLDLKPRDRLGDAVGEPVEPVEPVERTTLELTSADLRDAAYVVLSAAARNSNASGSARQRSLADRLFSAADLLSP